MPWFRRRRRDTRCRFNISSCKVFGLRWRRLAAWRHVRPEYWPAFVWCRRLRAIRLRESRLDVFVLARYTATTKYWLLMSRRMMPSTRPYPLTANAVTDATECRLPIAWQSRIRYLVERRRGIGSGRRFAEFTLLKDFNINVADPATINEDAGLTRHLTSPPTKHRLKWPTLPSRPNLLGTNAIKRERQGRRQISQ